MNQMMVALYDANPDAFADNINVLREGAILRVPDREMLSLLAPESATVSDIDAADLDISTGIEGFGAPLLPPPLTGVGGKLQRDWLELQVQDFGCGIPRDQQTRIFDKFFRSSDVQVQDQTGSGLALSLTNEIVRLHGGRLTVHSELNKGTRFTVRLPLTSEMTPCSNV